MTAGDAAVFSGNAPAPYMPEWHSRCSKRPAWCLRKAFGPVRTVHGALRSQTTRAWAQRRTSVCADMRLIGSDFTGCAGYDAAYAAAQQKFGGSSI